MTIDVTVVIPCHTVLHVLPDQLAALAAQNFAGSFEVVLSENGGGEDLAAHVPTWSSKFGLDLRVVDAQGVRGVSHARNVGLRAGRAPLVAICDADDLVTPGWLAALAAASADAELVGGAMDTATLNSEVTRAWRPGPKKDRLPVKLDFLPYAMGCNLAVDRETALSIGGWREDFVAGGDDVDFAWRLQLAGGRLALSSDAVVAYRYRTDLRGTVRQTYHYARCDALLLREFADRGARARPGRQTLADARWLVGRVRDLRGDPGVRGRWLCRAAALHGRVAGSFTHRRWVG